jgi:hypothetical protein
MEIRLNHVARKRAVRFIVFAKAFSGNTPTLARFDFRDSLRNCKVV